MKRSDFLKGIGLVSAGTFLPLSKVQAAADAAAKTTSCNLIPSETEGPFPLDLTTNSTFFRPDVREDRTGTTLNLKLKILGNGNCSPMTNVRVNIWACDKDGVYSGYDNAQNPGSTTATYQRGFQMTDANAEVNFTAIFPGWYSGRVCHIHFQVFVSSVYKAVSQLTFPETAKNSLYATNSLYTKGADPLSISADNIFSDGYTYQMATLTPNTDGVSYGSYMEVTIQGTGTTGLETYEGETGGHFKMGQNFPNPYRDETTIPFTLSTASDVKIELFGLSARKMTVIERSGLSIGDHTITVNTASLGIPSGNYIYQLEATNSEGVFRQCDDDGTISFS